MNRFSFLKAIRQRVKYDFFFTAKNRSMMKHFNVVQHYSVHTTILHSTKVHTLGKRCHLPSFNRLRLRMATMIFHAWHLQLFVDLGVRVEYLLPLLMDSDIFFSPHVKWLNNLTRIFL